MPLYGYFCAHCGKTCEVLQKLDESPKVTCPYCSKDQLQRQISAPRFQLKGSGWYETDFKNKTTTQKEEAPPTKKPESEKKSSDTQS